MKRLTRITGAVLLACAAWAPLSSHAVEVLNEGFGDVSKLSGWSQLNNSMPPGTGWFQGYTDVFGAQRGPGNSYAAANYLGAANGMGVVDNWLITPTLALSGISTLSFWARSEGTAGFSDLLEVRFASGSGSTAEDFDVLLLTIGGEAAFPSQWQQWSANLTVEGEGRFAFRYLGDAATLDYVGLDSVRVVTAVPEPTSYLMLLGGLGVLGASARRLRRGPAKDTAQNATR
ncbi:choice-of-anchor J family PEP-CTERM protein [uncultured Massilia sp.]|uniref:choice-of-anchor J family PEP-CTERM protein n=1 Tax=uncultured Massilia sp. TaxID=169973 RepID=UPI00258BD4F6|nr:choice-of-anchor J domain-containing protein [uncultured Massilia sp.]